jgi:alkanesulfonate monooxygenase SsuD/methylene tetrahydromethanopterin reductase-like flavin-dependent oxidoreductase (luciferase family)
MAIIGLRYDLRSPDWAATKHPEMYAACLEQSAWADEHGVDIVTLSEHHGVDDGFLPSPMTMAAAIASRTKRVPITIAAALFPLHDPIRLAEQIAIVDLVSRGRVSIVAGAGYAQQEFEMAGIDRKQRGKMLEASIETMRKAWTGEPFEYEGRMVRVTPVPFSKPHPMILIGGSSEAAAKRAARLRLAFFPAIDDPELIEIYQQACAEEGFTGGFSMLPHGPGFVHVTEDPEKAWAELADYAWYDAETYRSWQTPGTRSQVASKAADIEELKQEGIYRIVTPDECVAMADELGPAGALVLHPLLCGMPLDLGWASLELFATKVLPRIRPGAGA